MTAKPSALCPSFLAIFKSHTASKEELQKNIRSSVSDAPTTVKFPLPLAAVSKYRTNAQNELNWRENDERSESSMEGARGSDTRATRCIISRVCLSRLETPPPLPCQ